MVRLAGWSIVGLVVLMASGARAQTENRRGEAFGPGEQLTYRVSYLGLTAGSAQVTVGSEMKQWGEEVWPIVATAKSESVVDLYRIKDRFVSYWDDRRQRTLGSDFYVDENRKRRRQRIRLDEATATVTDQREGHEESTHAIGIPAGTLDMAAATFLLRNKDLRVGNEYALPVFTGRKLFTLKARVEGTERIPTTFGEREVFRVRVSTEFSGKLEARRDLLAYFTADSRHVPVKVEADLLLGNVVGELVQYEPGRDRVSEG